MTSKFLMMLTIADLTQTRLPLQPINHREFTKNPHTSHQLWPVDFNFNFIQAKKSLYLISHREQKYHVEFLIMTDTHWNSHIKHHIEGSHQHKTICHSWQHQKQLTCNIRWNLTASNCNDVRKNGRPSLAWIVLHSFDLIYINVRVHFFIDYKGSGDILSGILVSFWIQEFKKSPHTSNIRPSSQGPQLSNDSGYCYCLT